MNKRHYVSRFLVYGLVDTATGAVRYVGKSSSGMKRALSHRCACSRKDTTHLGRWLSKQYETLGLVPGVLVLAECTDNDDANKKEQEIIARLREAEFDLVNITGGGEGNVGWSPSDETRAKQSLAHKGKKGAPCSPERKEALRLKFKGRVFSQESIEKMIKSRTGKKQTPEHIEHNRVANLGRKLTAEHRSKIAVARKGKRYPRKKTQTTTTTQKDVLT